MTLPSVNKIDLSLQRSFVHALSSFGLFVWAILQLVLVQPADGQEISFADQIRPVLKERCFACHGALKQEASLRVDSVGFLKQGGDSGDAVDTESVDESEILIRLTEKDESLRMPPEGKPLDEKEIGLIRKWIEQGAKAPANDLAEAAPDAHWGFQPPQKVDLPTGGVQTNPIDQLLERQRKKARVSATDKLASKRQLLRRVYLDLIGVPPTLKQMNDFVEDHNPDAYERVVDRLLNQPQYGERWGRHWMDVWRYTDWYGLGAQLRNSQKHIWHWRDWIVESLNQDQGYDQMILEMLAADELYPTDQDKLRASGFLARNYYLFNRTTWLDSTIEHTGKAFLGLTMNCAKCHDHKYDPFPQTDYYRLRAIFEPHQIRLDPVPGTTDLEKNGIPRAFDAHPEAETFIHVRGNEKDPDKSTKIEPGVPAFFQYQGFRPQEVSLPIEGYRPYLLPFAMEDRLKAVDKEIENARVALVKAEQQLTSVRKDAESKPSKAVDYNSVDLWKKTNDSSFVDDHFDQFDDKVWQVVNGTWKIEKGHLLQSEVGATSRIVQSLKDHPADFLLEASLSVSGGQMWKSFGVRFDASGGHEKTVYLSAHQPSKVQVSYANNGQTVYPTNALANLPVKLNESYQLRIAVRGRLINVSVNGKHLVSYNYPVDRQVGKLQLMSFDSVASFDSIKIVTLPEFVTLRGSGQGQPLTLASAEHAVQVSKAKLAAVNLKRKAITLGFNAERAKATSDPNVDSLIREAAIHKVHFDLANKRLALIEAKRKLELAATKEKAKLQKSLDALEKQVAAFDKKLKQPGTEYLTVRASRKALEGPDEKPASRDQPYPGKSTGRRTAFARWIIDRQNPLTARVAVNQIWMRHFGQPLLDSVTDFGRRAKEPVQRELLDWLAVDLMQHGWKMKRLHRLIVTSRAYRMASADEKVTVSNGNPYYQIRSPVRMESQVVRDSLLQLSGELVEQPGGPPIDPAKNAMSKRRSLYFRQSRDHQHKFVSMFDDADILRCYRRQESIIPQQALTLSNSRLTYESARKIAENLSSEWPESDKFITQAFSLIICREPTPEEMTYCSSALEKLEKLTNGKPDSRIRSRTTMIMGIINSNDFVTIR